MLTEKEKIKIKNEKKLKSFRNKMGSNIVWFDSLTKQRQYDLLFEWQNEKYRKRFVTKPTVVRKTVWDSINYKRKIINVTEYPANLKHFIREVKQTRRYKSSVVKIRETAIDLILKNN